MRKLKKTSIKIFSIMCLIITLLSYIVPNLCYATSGTFEVYNISTYITTTENSEYYGICGKKIYDSTTKKWKTAFCIELRCRTIYGK